MEHKYRLMKESMLQLNSLELNKSDFVLNMEKTIWANTEPNGIYPSLKIRIEVKCIRVGFDAIIFKCKNVERIVWLDRETPPYLEYSEFYLSIRGVGKKRGLFQNKYNQGSATRSVYSRKLFLQPFDAHFMPREFYNPTSLTRRRKDIRDCAYPYDDELMFAYLYWKKRAIEQEKYYKWLGSSSLYHQGNVQSSGQPSY